MILKNINNSISRDNAIESLCSKHVSKGTFPSEMCAWHVYLQFMNSKINYVLDTWLAETCHTVPSYTTKYTKQFHMSHTHEKRHFNQEVFCTKFLKTYKEIPFKYIVYYKIFIYNHGWTQTHNSNYKVSDYFILFSEWIRSQISVNFHILYHFGIYL